MKDKKIILVTGANRGIGLETSVSLANAGHKVIMGARNKEALDEKIANIKFTNENPDTVQLDVTDDNSINKTIEYISGKYNRVDVLINNAGIYIDKDESIFDTDIEVFEQTFLTNFYGVLKLTRKIIPFMKENNAGHIINVSSNMGAMSKMSGYNAAYRVSKSALNALTLIAASELRGTGISINAVTPGWTRTEMGGSDAARSVVKGAETIIWLAEMSNNLPNGKFFMDKEETEW